MNGTFIPEVRRRKNPTAAGFVGDDFVPIFIGGGLISLFVATVDFNNFFRNKKNFIDALGSFLLSKESITHQVFRPSNELFHSR